jgi:uncharacterized protein (TIGR00296 family)
VLLKRRKRKTTFEINEKEAEYLVKLARNTIQEKLGKKVKPLNIKNLDKLNTKCGVFVTLNKDRNGIPHLRGCIGIPYPVMPLLNAIKESAINAAFNDPRFPPITVKEINSIIIEVSVLTPPQQIIVNDPLEYPNKIKIGKDGLIIERGYYKGLLLPQVAVEWSWDATEFLTQCCLKAGLSPDSWLMKETKVSKFQALIFSEFTPNGKIIKKNLMD